MYIIIDFEKFNYNKYRFNYIYIIVDQFSKRIFSLLYKNNITAQ